MNNTYKIVTAEDGIHWICLEPLRDDLNNMMHELMDLKETDLSTQQIQQTHAAFAMVNALIQEAELIDLAKKNMQ